MKKALILVFILYLDNGEGGSVADKAFGFTNFKIKLKSNQGVINRNVIDKVSRDDDISREVRKVQSGNKRNGKRIPMTFILNERFKNPKFVSRNPKRQKSFKNSIPLTNNILDEEKKIPELVRKKLMKKPLRKKSSKRLSTLNHANILNTNFRFAFLKRMKHKLEASSNSNPREENRSLRKRTRKVKRVRKKLK